MAREIPSYVSQLSMGSRPQVQFTDARAGLFNKVSAEMQVMSEDIQKKNAQIEKLTATSVMSENMHRIAREAGSDVGKLTADMEGFKKTFIAGIKDNDLRQELEATFGAQAAPFVDKAMNQYAKNVQEQHKLALYNAWKQTRVDLTSAAPGLLDPKPEIKQSSAAAVKNIFERAADLAASKNADGSFIFSPEEQIKMAAEAQRDALTSLPADKRIEMLGGGGNFDTVIAGVFKHEGGYNASDGNTGNPVNFGINQGSHPEIDVKTLTKEQAAEIYKRDYWDAYKIGELAPEVQGIVMDGVVNHYSGFKDKLVAAARAGATPSQLIDMRQKEYDRLERTGKYSKAVVASWNNRLADYEHLVVGENLGFLDGEDRKKLLEEAVSEFKSQEERANIMRVVGVAAKDKEIYARFMQNSPGILQDIEDYKNNGGDPELANYMRTSALTRNKLSSGEQDAIYSNIIDEVGQLGISIKNGKVKIEKDDAKLEDLVRLQQKIMKASVQGVTGLDSQLKKLSPAILEKARRERGKDDIGLLWNDPNEPLDNGYEVIQKYLEKQGKDKDYAVKASLIRDFIEKTDRLPEDIKKDEALFNQAQEEIARSVIASDAGRGMKNIPLPAITRLLANPGEKDIFNQTFGAGSAEKILGNK